MEKRHMKSYVQASILCLSIVCILQACSVFSDRTTSVYGTITDEKGQAVDSIEVKVYGAKLNGFYPMASALSDSTGHYEVVLEVAGKFSGLEILISPNSSNNLKYRRIYSGYDSFMDSRKCGYCQLSIGSRNNMDFHLKTK